jgi:glycosyltransferase involved in cell wall biosynthesis
MKNIFVLLPHKDQFIINYSGSASIWVKDFNKYSKYKDNITVFGFTKNLHNLINKKKYVNLDIPAVKFTSRTKIYVQKFINYIKKNKPDLIEIHNRPSYLLKIHKIYSDINFSLIIHNDPKQLKGSQSINERIQLLNICKKIYFVSSWVEEKFFEGIDKNFYNNFKVVFPSINKLFKFPKKENIIVFAGKLNSTKGFNKFVIAIKKILNKHKNWKALAIGDEPRENIILKHKNFYYTGWISHNKVLDYYSKSSITVVPSNWDEPFGRSSLEAGSRGNAVILSKKGGLPETINFPIFLKNVSSKEIFYELEKLISNKKLLNFYQLNNFKKPLHLIKNNSKILDTDRDEIIKQAKNINLNFNKKLKILHIYNRAEKISGRIYFISTGKKIENGLIRLGHDVETISDRDIINYTPIYNRTNYINKLIKEKTDYYRPDLILLGHVNSINFETFEYLKKNKGIKISQWYEDNLSLNGPDFDKNLESLKINFEYIDNFFISTHPDDVDKKTDKINYHFLPTPVDKNIEKLDVFKNKNFIFDVFFALSHGVNRGNIKKGKFDEREDYIKKIINHNKNIKFDIYGLNQRSPVWAEAFYNSISNSYMAININRGKSKKYSSSNRIGSLVGNGLLTFMDLDKKFNDFFSSNEIIFFSNLDDLSDKLNFFKRNIDLAKKIAMNGKKKYFKLFNEKEVANYIVRRSINPYSKYKPIWEKKLLYK